MYANNSISVFYIRIFAFLATVLAASAQPYGYVSNEMGNNISVVNRATNTISATISVSAAGLTGLAITPNGSYIYAADQSKNSIAVISTASNSVVATVPVGTGPIHVAITPNGATAYVANTTSNSVSVINTATN